MTSVEKFRASSVMKFSFFVCIIVVGFLWWQHDKNTSTSFIFLKKLLYASDINDAMKLAAADAIASLVSDEELTAEHILPDAFDPRVGKTVAAAVAKAARDSGVARL